MQGVPNDGTAESAYEEVFTVLHDLSLGEDIAWIRGAIWPPVGTVVELEAPERHALVVGIRLVLQRGNTALVRVDVQDPGEGELIARDAATRMLAEDVVPATGEALLAESAEPALPLRTADVRSPSRGGARSDPQEDARKGALTAFLEARAREGFRVETRTDTHAIIVAGEPSRSIVDRLRRTRTAERHVVSVNEHGEVTMAPAEPLRF